MIVTTKGSSALLKKAFGKDGSDILAFKNILDGFKIDPTTFTPERDVYVLCSDDIRGKAIVNQFVEALSAKHPRTKVVFIDKGMKATFVDTAIPGLDLYLRNPKADQVAERITSLINVDLTDVVRDYEKERKIEDPEEDFNPNDVFNSSAEEKVEEQEPDFQQPEPIVEEPEEQEEEIVMPADTGRTGNTFVERIESSVKVADISMITKEITATALMKEMIETNSSYADIEVKLKSLNNSIYEILNDSSIPTISEKLDKVRALLHDRAYFASKGDTLIEQRIEDIINTICERAAALINGRLADIDKTINRLKMENASNSDSVRLAGLSEERSNLLAELHTYVAELTELYDNSENAVFNAVLALTKSVVAGEDGSHIRDIIAANGGIPISEETVAATKGTIELSLKLGDSISSMKEACLVLISAMQRIMDIDREVIQAQAAMIKLQKAKTTEDFVVQHGALKSSLKMYTGIKGSGTSIIPYILSEYKSRQRANVLYIDITGESRLSDYGIESMTLNDYISDLPEKQFAVVTGKLEDNVENGQTLLNAMYKAADYYKVITLVVSPEQKTILEALSIDCLSINYIVEPTPQKIELMKNVIKSTDYENVGKRILLNKCGVSASKTLKLLDMNDRLDISLVQVPYILDIATASFEHYNPCLVSNVIYTMEEVLRKC